MELLLAMLAGELRLRVIPVYLFGQISLCQVSLQSQRRLICPIVILFNLYVICKFDSVSIFIFRFSLLRIVRHAHKPR